MKWRSKWLFDLEMMLLIRKDFSLTINNSFQTSFNKCSIMTAVSYKKKSSKKSFFFIWESKHLSRHFFFYDFAAPTTLRALIINPLNSKKTTSQNIQPPNLSQPLFVPKKGLSNLKNKSTQPIMSLLLHFWDEINDPLLMMKAFIVKEALLLSLLLRLQPLNWPPKMHNFSENWPRSL